MRRVGDDGQVLQGFIHSLLGRLALVLQDGLGLERLLPVFHSGTGVRRLRRAGRASEQILAASADHCEHLRLVGGKCMLCHVGDLALAGNEAAAIV